MNVKIISDGSTGGTKIINEATGEPIGLVQKVTWSIDSDSTFAKCVLELVKIPVELASPDTEIKYVKISETTGSESIRDGVDAEILEALKRGEKDYESVSKNTPAPYIDNNIIFK